MHAIDLLIADHNRLRGLVARYQQASKADDAAGASELASKLLDELSVHMAIEEDIFYPAANERSDEILEELAATVSPHTA